MGISIIVPAYNSEKFLAAAIQSVQAQSLPDWELVVVNDGSTDQTGPIADKFARRDRRIRVVYQENAGAGAARNRGLAETRKDFEYVKFLDSDDLLEADALEISLQVLKQDQEAVGAHGLLRYIDKEDKPLASGGSYIWPERRRGIQGKILKTWPVTAPTTFEVLAYSNFIPTGAIMIRRAAIDRVGGFDPSLKIVEDWQMWLLLSRLGHIAFINRVLLNYRRHENNITNTEALKRVNNIERGFLESIYRSVDLNDKEKTILSLGYRYRKLYSAKIQLSYAVRKLSRRRLTEAAKELQGAVGHIVCAIKRG